MRQRLLRNPSAIVGLVLIAVFVLVGIFAPLLAPYNPTDADLSIIRPGHYPGPSAQHQQGEDPQGPRVRSPRTCSASTSSAATSCRGSSTAPARR